MNQEEMWPMAWPDTANCLWEDELYFLLQSSREDIMTILEWDFDRPTPEDGRGVEILASLSRPSSLGILNLRWRNLRLFEALCIFRMNS